MPALTVLDKINQTWVLGHMYTCGCCGYDEPWNWICGQQGLQKAMWTPTKSVLEAVCLRFHSTISELISLRFGATPSAPVPVPEHMLLNVKPFCNRAYLWNLYRLEKFNNTLIFSHVDILKFFLQNSFSISISLSWSFSADNLIWIHVSQISVMAEDTVCHLKACYCNIQLK